MYENIHDNFFFVNTFLKKNYFFFIFLLAQSNSLLSLGKISCFWKNLMIQLRKPFKRGTNMAYKIDAGTCVNCGTCEPDCPVGAISENGGHREIDATKCISCGTCASECPATAISEA